VATLTVWRFPTPHGADEAEYTLHQLQKQGLIKVHDAALVRWDIGAKKPRTRQLNNLIGAGALGGSFWGLLFGILFFVPLLGVAIGAAMGAWAGSLTDVGIDDDFIKSVRDQVTPGTSALFLMTSEAVMDRVAEAMAGQEMELISTDLSADQEMALREAFAG
jgi:uncharacterized membrane protein